MFGQIQTFYKDQRNIRRSKIFPMIAREMNGKIDSMEKLEVIISMSDVFNAPITKYVNSIIAPLPVLDPKSHQNNIDQANDMANYLKLNPEFIKLEQNWEDKDCYQKKEIIIKVADILEKFFAERFPATNYQFVDNMPNYNIGSAEVITKTLSSLVANRADVTNIFINTGNFALNNYSFCDYIGCLIHERRHTVQPINLLRFSHSDDKDFSISYFWNWAEQDANDVACLTLTKLGDLSRSEPLKQEYYTSAHKMVYFPEKDFSKQMSFMKKMVNFRGKIHV